MHLQLWPTGKTVLTRDRVLCVREFRSWVAALQFAKQTLRALLEMIEIRKLWQIARHFASFISRRPLTGKRG
jgi:hypothetical protein